MGPSFNTLSLFPRQMILENILKILIEVFDIAQIKRMARMEEITHGRYYLIINTDSYIHKPSLGMDDAKS